MSEPEKLITTAELADKIGVTSRAVRKWRAAGTITPALMTPGGHPRWRWSDVERELREQRKRPE